MTTLSQYARDNALAHAEHINQLMTALNVDYDQLEELTDYAQDLRDELDNVSTELEAIYLTLDADAADAEREAQLDEHTRLTGLQDELAHQLSDTAAELEDLQAEAGEYTDADEVSTALHEYPLSVEIRSGWESVGEPLEPTEYAILLSTGGPAARIRGELDEHGAPASAWMEAQDWGTPWTEVRTRYDDALLEFAQFLLPC